MNGAHVLHHEFVTDFFHSHFHSNKSHSFVSIVQLTSFSFRKGFLCRVVIPSDIAARKCNASDHGDCRKFSTSACPLFIDCRLGKNCFNNWSFYVCRYVPPITATSPNLPETPEEISMELRKQESLLSQIHSEMNAGFVTKKREEELWETQRIITQLKVGWM